MLRSGHEVSQASYTPLAPRAQAFVARPLAAAERLPLAAAMQLVWARALAARGVRLAPPALRAARVEHLRAAATAPRAEDHAQILVSEGRTWML